MKKVLLAGIPRTGSTVIWQILLHFRDFYCNIGLLRTHNLIDINADYIILPFRNLMDVVCSSAAVRDDEDINVLSEDAKVLKMLLDDDLLSSIDLTCQALSRDDLRGKIITVKYEDFFPNNIEELSDYLHHKIYSTSIPTSLSASIVEFCNIDKNKERSERFDSFAEWDETSMIHGNHITSEGKGGRYLSLSLETQDIMNKRLEKYQKKLGYVK